MKRQPGRKRLLALAALVVAALFGHARESAGDERDAGSWKEEAERLRLRLEQLERRLGPQPAQAPAPVTTATPSTPVTPATPADVAPSTSANLAGKLDPDEERARDLDDLLGKQHLTTDFGGFGIRLSQYGVQPYVHGYVTNSYLATKGFPTFRAPSGSRISLENSFFLAEFAVMVGANVKDTIIPEVQFVYETGGSSTSTDPQAIHLRYGQVDIHLHDLLTFRVGKFLIPFGRYNESLYPEFLFPISRFLLRSYQSIVPVVWADTGFQVRGRYRFYEGLELNYAAFVVNGLRQNDKSTVPGVIDDGASIPSLRANNDFAVSNGLKTWGGRLGFKALGADAGVSIAGGPYTADSKRYLYFGGYYFYFRYQGFSLGTEGVLCLQERARPNSSYHQRGSFAYVAYRFFEVPLPLTGREIDIEPVAAIDYTYTDRRQQNTRLYMAGLQFYFLPKDLPNAKLSFTGGVLDSHAIKTIDLFVINFSLAF